jgi:hypothetical protein
VKKNISSLSPFYPLADFQLSGEWIDDGIPSSASDVVNGNNNIKEILHG